MNHYKTYTIPAYMLHAVMTGNVSKLTGNDRKNAVALIGTLPPGYAITGMQVAGICGYNDATHGNEICACVEIDVATN